MYFLWEQVGAACLGGIAVILLAIPMTGKISSYLKGIQKVNYLLRLRLCK
jgi:hypothetical protein